MRNNRPEDTMLEDSNCCIFPKASELSEIVNNIECPEENCNDIFHNPSNLTLHLQKRHGKTVESKTACRPKYAQFYCPEKGCKYCFNPDVSNVDKKFSNRYFTQFRYLKQHYIKVHMVKPFICGKCNKGFPTELHRTRHDEECGSKYTCSCGVEYSSISALKTHSMRKDHVINTTNSMKTKEKSRPSKSAGAVIANNDADNQPNDITALTKNLAKGASVLILHGVVNLEDLSNTNLFQLVKLNSSSPTVETASQTENATSNKRKKSASPVKSTEKNVKKRMSQQTQTGEKNPKKSSETQTINQFLKETKIKTSAKRRKKSMKTQTIVKPEPTESTVNQVRDKSHTEATEELNLNYQATSRVSETIVKLEPTEKTVNQVCETPHTDTSKKLHLNDYATSHIKTEVGDRKIIERPLLDEESISSESDNFKKHDICLPQLWLNNENSKEIDCKDISSLLERKSDDRSLGLYQDSNSSDRNYASLCHIETQTDNRLNNFLDDYLTNCETQTNDILDQDTRWTQTCDDTFLPELVDFTNNETQTAWSFLNNSPLSSSISLVHSETQTPPHVQEFNISQL